MILYAEHVDEVGFRGLVCFVDENHTVGVSDDIDDESAAVAPLAMVFHDPVIANLCKACEDEHGELERAYAARVEAIRASIDADLVSFRDGIREARRGVDHDQFLKLPDVVPGLRPAVREILASLAGFSECPETVFTSDIRAPDFTRLYAIAPDLWGSEAFCEPPPARQLFAAHICPELRMTLDMTLHVDRTWSANLFSAYVPPDHVSPAALHQLKQALQTCGTNYEVDENYHFWTFVGQGLPPCPGCPAHWSTRQLAEVVTW